MGITTAGMGQIAKICLKDVDDTLSFDSIAIGTGTTAFSAGQTALVAEQQRSTFATTVGTVVTTTSMSLVKDSFSFAGSYTISEVGVFNSESTGTMLCRSLLSPYVSVTSSDTLKVTVLVEVKQGA